MSFNVRLKVAQLPTASTGIAGAVGTVVTGNAVPLAAVTPDTLSALVTTIVATNTVTLTSKWQCSNDAVTWYDIATAVGTTRTGTGSTVTFTEVLRLGTLVWRYARVAVTVGGTTAIVSSEFYAVAYTYLAPPFI